MRFFVCILVLLFVHNQFSRADKTLTDDSLYTDCLLYTSDAADD